VLLEEGGTEGEVEPKPGIVCSLQFLPEGGFSPGVGIEERDLDSRPFLHGHGKDADRVVLRPDQGQVDQQGDTRAGHDVVNEVLVGLDAAVAREGGRGTGRGAPLPAVPGAQKGGPRKGGRCVSRGERLPVASVRSHLPDRLLARPGDHGGRSDRQGGLLRPFPVPSLPLFRAGEERRSHGKSRQGNLEDIPGGRYGRIVSMKN